ncbi:class I SAM-dependent methyltransferase [Rhizobium laguerreae]|uniref:class I SAM-dependent methyltransferase n=2 Tax=Rhizobium laguerreae TaxID=1076926 RepID=UPI001E54C767|nr:class I SAM-dependent methyltransferase [Rhizobium laguerreae]MBY3167867.1 class I SAM-dependent methyltransferase [Rhizobium laguerreae]UFW64886.1 class I SAM-dependent methyltransferase [Rhizobium laguerreae]
MMMNKLQKFMYNEGERLVPYISHNQEELVRHRSSYAFFHRVIKADGDKGAGLGGPSIVDLGSGTGYGCSLLSSIPGASIVGVDIEDECRSFAEQYYPRRNVDYVIEDLTAYIPGMPRFDYAVSRGVLEHVPGGISLIGQIKYNKRVLVDVPYDEKPGNEHHVITGILEKDFAILRNKEIFYEDIEGNIYREDQKPAKSNLILIVLSDPDLPKVSEMFDFPIPAVRDNAIELESRATFGGKRFDLSRDKLLAEAAKAIRETDVVADIGCGIVPMNYFRPKLHLMVEPWKEYADILSYRHRNDKSVMVIRLGALEALKSLSDKSVDSLFMLDVIEHMTKDMGIAVLAECDRVAREQIVLFTPLGFMPQHMEDNQKDGWGLSGTSVQEHLSGWTPEDFGPEWSFYVCTDFHQVDFKREALEKTYGAFFAIRNFDPVHTEMPETYSDLRRKLPSEIEADELRVRAAELTAHVEGLQQAYSGLLNSRSVRLAKKVKAFLGR